MALQNKSIDDSFIEEDEYNHAVSTTFQALTLNSAFQPIISIPHRRAVGYEALVRASDDRGEPCSPLTLFSLPKSSRQKLQLDRACRSIHVQNFSRQKTTGEWLFLNLNSQGLESERPEMGFMTRSLSDYGIAPQRVVIEILETEIDDRDYLKSLIKHFRELGCLIAIDDFGAGHSNFERIWDLEPDIVKLDRSMVVRAANSSKVKRILLGIVSLIHETGSLVIIEGVETKKEALIAIDVGADMVQGFYFAYPHADINLNPDLDQALVDLIELHRQESLKHNLQLDHYFARFHKLYEEAVSQLLVNTSLDIAANIIFKEYRAIRCFLLDETGHQRGNSIHAHPYKHEFDKRVLPLLFGKNASWSHKYYHSRAINQPGKIQVTRPYLSVAGLHMCITVSQALNINGSLFVFCCDLEWQDD
jgi:EAL domain-containing protein (putative c-di-GMP-specific phosphodiesterase class I)